MKLIDTLNPVLISISYKLLEEREPHQNIGHAPLPTYEEHIEFVNSRPYKHWYLIVKELSEVYEHMGVSLGTIYITHNNEIGIGILKEHQRKGYGKQAVRMLMEANPSPTFLADVTPFDFVAERFFINLGFDLRQFRFRLDVSHSRRIGGRR